MDTLLEQPATSVVRLTVLGSGSRGNALVIECGSAALLVDAGFSGAELIRRLVRARIDPASIQAIVVSHEHEDHTRGLRTFAQRHGKIPAYANSLTAERLRLAKRAPENMMIFNNGFPFTIGDFTVEAFSVSHDAVDPVGFVVRCQERKIGIATDFGYAGKMTPLKLKDSHILVLESNHDPAMLHQSRRPPQLKHRILGRRGHLSNKLAAELLPQVVGAATRHLILAHLSDECNTPRIAQDTLAAALAKMGREDVNLLVAGQDEVCPTVTV